MSFNLSVVNIVSDQYRDDINTVAEIFGCGKDNLSVKLKNSEGAIYWGCHSWWRPDDYALFSDVEFRKTIIPDELENSLQFLYERLVLDGNPLDNWNAALTECDLTIHSEEV